MLRRLAPKIRTQLDRIVQRSPKVRQKIAGLFWQYHYAVARPRKPRAVDWTFDQNALLDQMKGAIVEKHGHVYLCIENVLPPALYRACLAYWPRDDQFQKRNRTRICIHRGWLDEAPLDEKDRAFWRRFGDEIISGKIKAALVKAFKPYMRLKFDFLSDSETADIQKQVSFVDHPIEGLNLDKGFRVGPHVDQNYIFVTSLLYMPSDRSQSDMGTMLFEPLSPSTRTMDTVYIDEAKVRQVHQFPFTPNTLVSFLQTPVAFHGIIGKTYTRPRRLYQFNVVMDDATVARAYGSHSGAESAY